VPASAILLYLACHVSCSYLVYKLADNAFCCYSTLGTEYFKVWQKHSTVDGGYNITGL
jgi:hypothetical protein